MKLTFALVQTATVLPACISLFFSTANLPAYGAQAPAASVAQAQPSALEQCDAVANDPTDPMKVGNGVNIDWLSSRVGSEAVCQNAVNLSPTPHYIYLLGRTNESVQDYSTAAQEYMQAAGQGYAAAMNALGALYAKGQGVAKDDGQALVWFRNAAAGGDAEGMANVGTAYAAGDGVAKSDPDALTWYQNSANAGNGDGMLGLARMYLVGEGVTQDISVGSYWADKARAAGNIEDSKMMEEAGELYQQGLIVPQSDPEAAAWYREAAEAGNEEGMYHLGLMLRAGKGVAWNETEAMQWFTSCLSFNSQHVRQDLPVFVGCAQQLGRGYFDGLGGGTQDYSQAAIWFRYAAERNDPWSEVYMGIIDENGWGMAKDTDAAKSWFTKAAGGTDQTAAQAGKSLGDQLQKTETEGDVVVALGVVALIGVLAAASSGSSQSSSTSAGDRSSPSQPNTMAAQRQKQSEKQSRCAGLALAASGSKLQAYTSCLANPF